MARGDEERATRRKQQPTPADDDPIDPHNDDEDESQDEGNNDENNDDNEEDEYLETGESSNTKGKTKAQTPQPCMPMPMQPPGQYLYPNSTPYPYYPPPPATSETAIMHAVAKAQDVKKLNAPEDWPAWRDHLKAHLSMVGLWKPLIGTATKPVGDPFAIQIWENNQEKLASLLYLTSGPCAVSILRLHQDKDARTQFRALKDKFDRLTVTFNSLFTTLYRSKLSDYKDFREYAEAVMNARNELTTLGRQQDELAVSCAYLQGLGQSYATWKQHYLTTYDDKVFSYDAKGNKVVNPFTIEEILVRLNDNEKQQQLEKRNITSSSSSRAFGAKDKKPSRTNSSANTSSRTDSRSKKGREKKHCNTCHSDRHGDEDCWYTHPQKQNEAFKRRYPTPEAVKEALEERQKAHKEW